MDKNILVAYIDACALVTETEQRIQMLKKKQEELQTDRVTGSNPDFPFEAKSFKIQGLVNQIGEIEKQEKLLQAQMESAQELKTAVEAWLPSAPLQMQRIIRLRFFEKLSWWAVANRLGQNHTGDGVRMRVERFLKKN